MKKIYIWGTGNKAQTYLKTQEISFEQLCGFIETKREKFIFNGKNVYEPSEMANLEYDFILVLVEQYTNEIKQTALECGIDLRKVVFFDTVIWTNGDIVRFDDKMRTSVSTIPCADDESMVADNFPKLYEMIQEKRFYARSIISTYRNAKDDIDDSVIVMQEGFDSRIYSDDYFRCRTFEFVADEILKNNVEGACAEVGVFQGHFARLINAKLNQKKLYLFDTFEGFDKVEIEKEIECGKAPLGCENDFVGTSVSMVMNSMPYPEKCVVKKGYFPGTSIGLEEETYSFVSIDVDLEESILECLRYFYPRLVVGGYIFVHDYNNRKFFGVKDALERYEKELGGTVIRKIPIADQGGTVVIIK